MSATQRELLEERWKVLMRDVQRVPGEYDISTVNSRRFRLIDDTLDELAGMLVDEVNGDEMDTLTGTTEYIWTVIRQRLLTWAEQTEEQRAARRAA